MRLFRSLIRDERGATAVEYGLIVTIISLAMIAGFTQFTGALTTTFATIQSSIEGATP